MTAIAPGNRYLVGCGVALLLAGCEHPPVETVQHGYRGTGMVEVYNPRQVASLAPDNALPEPIAAASAEGPRAREVFKNLRVLGDVSVGELTRTMSAMTAWVAPEQGCAYCHAAGQDLSVDALYTKVVARRMLQMTQYLNSNWQSHVAGTGVTCYTCHRGHNIPAYLWFTAPDQAQANRAMGNRAQQNAPAASVGLAALPNDPFTPFLLGADEIRIVGGTPLPTGNRKSIKQAEWTYGLMTHISEALGVNCTYCHNSRSFASWDSSTPQRATAWYGIRMVRALNNDYLAPLTATFPTPRLGPSGDVAKIHCATCHQGVYKPLYGASMLKDYPVLAAPVVAPPPPVAEAPPPADSAVVLFGVGSARLPADAGSILDALILNLKSSPDAKATISGYHSAAGVLAQNQDLAKRRAFAVRDALHAAGVPVGRIVLERPRSAEANLSGEDPRARRVEVSIH